MRVVIAEDSTLLREGLVRLLALDGIETVAAVDTAPALIDAVDTLAPDLAVIDVRMPPTFS
ncbi:MAG TPA: response regulator, partial [Dermatophilaceae bacterium]|nr:response regulator [Dermatophilaceae bacterium]